MRFKVKGGNHTTAAGQVITKGGTFESDVDLRTIFPNKFELAAEETAPAKAPAPVTPPPAPEAPAATDAKDVTSEFPEAGPNGLTVLRDKTGFWIRDDGDAVNDKAIRSKAGVTKEIADYLKE